MFDVILLVQLKLLTSVLQLLLRSHSELLGDVQKSLEALLIVAVPHYAACQRQRPSSQQVIIIVQSVKLAAPPSM